MKTLSRQVLAIAVTMACCVAFPLIAAQDKAAVANNDGFTGGQKAPLSTPPNSVAKTKTTRRERPAHANAEYARLPLIFEANDGQTDPQVKFLARGAGYHLFLTPTETVLTLQRHEPQARERAKRHAIALESPSSRLAQRADASVALRMKLVGANPQASVSALEQLPGKVNYFIGNDPKKWHTDIPTYAKVKYSEVYPGIDLIHYGNPGNLEFDFVVAPGADAKQIELAFEGADRLEIDARGDLVLHTALGEIRQHKPRVYQDVKGVRQEIASGYLLLPEQRVCLQLAEYDPTKALVIDPTISYSNTFGGSGEDSPSDLAVDSAGQIYVVGRTASIDFPARKNAYHGGSYDVFLTKFDPSQAGADSLLFSTYIGGSGNELDAKLALQETSSGTFIYVTGETDSKDFPATAAAYQRSLGGITFSKPDVFVTKVNPRGDSLQYSTYLGGALEEYSGDIAVDSLGNAYVTGTTYSDLFPIKNAYRLLRRGLSDAFVTKLNSTGSDLLYSTYIGGFGGDDGLAIAVLDNGVAFVAGDTGSGSFPTKSSSSLPPLQASLAGGVDVFVAKFDTKSSGEASLIYSTYLGGSGFDRAQGLAVDSNERAYITGFTQSPDFRVLVPAGGTFGGSYLGGTDDAFVAKLNADGTALFYSLFVGGNDSDVANSIAVDSSGNAFLTGKTRSSNLPTVNPLQSALAGTDSEAFITVVNASGTSLLFSSYFGGGNAFEGTGIAQLTTTSTISKLASHSAFVTGAGTVSVAFPDAFVAKISNVIGAGLTGAWRELTQRCTGSKGTCLLQGSFDVKNVGIDPAPNTVLQFFLSADNTLDETDQLLHQEAVGELGAGETKTRPFRVRLPGSAAGMFVIAVVDANNDVAEPNENNNVIVSSPIQ